MRFGRRLSDREGDTRIMQLKLMHWDEGYATGIGFVDSQHQQLFELVNDLHQAMQEGKAAAAIRALLQNLHRYADTHFRQEEEMMEAARYPDLEQHRLKHGTFLEHLKEFHEGLEKGEMVTIKVLNFLRDWIANHIRGTDRRYLPYTEQYRR